MSGAHRKMEAINEEIREKQIERDIAVDENDPERVAEIDAEIEVLNDNLRRIEMRLEKAEY